MNEFLEFMPEKSDTCYFKLDPAALEAMKRWVKIDCGCRAYEDQRRAMRPQILALTHSLPKVVGPIPSNSKVYRFYETAPFGR